MLTMPEVFFEDHDDLRDRVIQTLNHQPVDRARASVAGSRVETSQADESRRCSTVTPTTS